MYFQYRTPFGMVTIKDDDSNISSVCLGAVDFEDDKAPSSLTNKCANEIIEYLFGKRTIFDVPLKRDASDFKASVFDAISDIPYGQTRTSEQIAEIIGHGESYRLVGKAINECPISILIPTHRVIRTSNSRMESAGIADALRSLENKYKSTD